MRATVSQSAKAFEVDYEIKHVTN